MSTTIKDVAKKAGVSIATVSFVINNNNKRVSAETRDRILKTIKTLNYHPSKSARNLVSKKTGFIGFIITDDHFLRTEPFYTRIFLGVEFEARNEDYYILLTSVNSSFNKNEQLPRFILNKGVDGVIIAGKIPDNLIERLSKYNLPTIFIDFVPPSNTVPLVLIDNIQGGILATDHLINLGHKNIAFIGGDAEHPSVRDRLNGYKQSFEKAKIPLKNNLIIIDSPYPDRQNGYNSAKRLFNKNKNVTAIFACNDAMAIGVMHYLKDKGYGIPGDVSIIGFDDVEADLMLDPLLTTVRVPKVELGAEAFRLMANILKNKKTINKKILVPVELIVRDSTTQYRT